MAQAAFANESMSAAEHAAKLAHYIADGEARARAMRNRGPLRLDSGGHLHANIVSAYREHGFYVFQSVIDTTELQSLRSEVDAMLAAAPSAPDAGREARGREGSRYRFQKPSYRYAKPLSDPVGGTAMNKGRHPVRMAGPRPAHDAPEWTVELLLANLQTMDSCLRLYGHAGLLGIAESLLGPDFVPYNEVSFIKAPGLGPSVSWHQDGTTHWDAPDWDPDAHGFNSMTQLYDSTGGNGVWVVPGSHRSGKVDIRQRVAECGSEQLPEAVPLIAGPGDICVVNRQCVHGSFPNSSADRRVTLNAGFFPRARVLGVCTERLNGTLDSFDEARVAERSRLIPVAVDARAQRFANETRYVYQPLAGHESENRWNEDTREHVVKNYNQRDMYI